MRDLEELGWRFHRDLFDARMLNTGKVFNILLEKRDDIEIAGEDIVLIGTGASKLQNVNAKLLQKPREALAMVLKQPASIVV